MRYGGPRLLAERTGPGSGPLAAAGSPGLLVLLAAELGLPGTADFVASGALWFPERGSL
ncbi:hypothetical protein ACH4GP_11815 [Streptomyces celluloflavus]|uniref:Uncharacterized protein n=1 Tax=Streptomyces celluloflavus TaxID=58344 RepID=A0ABW7RBE3_9ACTN